MYREDYAAWLAKVEEDEKNAALAKLNNLEARAKSKEEEERKEQKRQKRRAERRKAKAEAKAEL